MEELYKKYYDSIEKLIEESEEMKISYDEKIAEEERKLGELKTQESLMVIGSKLKEEKREEIDSKNKEITDLKSAKDARSKYISDTSESIRNQIKKDIEDKMSKFKTKSEMEEAKKALEDKSNEAKEAQEKFENESKKVKELIAQKEALINERKKLDDLINNYGLYDNESTRNEIIEKIKAKQAEIETTAKGAIDFMDKGEELKSEKEKMEAEFNSYKPVSEHTREYEKLEALSYKVMSKTTFKLENVRDSLEKGWIESQEEKAKKDATKDEESKLESTTEIKQEESKEEKIIKITEETRQAEQPVTATKPTSERTETTEQPATSTKSTSERTETAGQPTTATKPIKEGTVKKEQSKEDEKTTTTAENLNEEIKKPEIIILAKQDRVIVNGKEIDNLGIAKAYDGKKELFKKLKMNKQIKGVMGKSFFLKRIFIDPIIVARIKSKVDPTIVELINRQEKEEGAKIGEEIGLSLADYIKSIRTKEELPVDLIYNLQESKFDNEELMSVENQMQRYARYANQITGVQVEGLKQKRSLFERLTEGLKTSGLIEEQTMADKIEQEYQSTGRDVDEEEKSSFRDEMKVNVTNQQEKTEEPEKDNSTKEEEKTQQEER